MAYMVYGPQSMLNEAGRTLATGTGRVKIIRPAIWRCYPPWPAACFLATFAQPPGTRPCHSGRWGRRSPPQRLPAPRV